MVSLTYNNEKPYKNDIISGRVYQYLCFAKVFANIGLEVCHVFGYFD